MAMAPSLPSPRWSLYNELLAAIPADATVEDILVGAHWTMVRSNLGLGLAMSPPTYGAPHVGGLEGFLGGELRRLAAMAKSWHPVEAALGVAAMNAYFNAPSTIRSTWRSAPDDQPNQSVFVALKSALASKRVTVVGHFPDLDQIAELCQLSILERNPQAGDFPDPACEYILHDQDYLFMTGVTLTNKTLPRLLELGAQSQIVLVGPSVPLTPLWFGKRVSLLAGTVVLEPERLWKHVALGGDRSVFKHGAHTVKLRAEDLRG
jgi:uncharacterized protein (DUF4213/DUF364 family)